MSTPEREGSFRIYSTSWNERNCLPRFLAITVLVALSALALSCANNASLPSDNLGPAPVLETVANTPDTSDWAVFSSRAHGFEFRHPDSCEVAELNESVYVGSRIELAILDPEGLSLTDYVERFVGSRAGNGDWIVESTKKGLLGGQEAITVEYRFGGGRRFGTATFTIRKAKVFVWSLTAGGFTCDEPDVYPPILSSFRFAE